MVGGGWWWWFFFGSSIFGLKMCLRMEFDSGVGPTCFSTKCFFCENCTFRGKCTSRAAKNILPNVQTSIVTYLKEYIYALSCVLKWFLLSIFAAGTAQREKVSNYERATTFRLLIMANVVGRFSIL